ncbi:sensor histidine kinase [Streptomyces cavernicola]|uniref:histidine kinase n=1 Tax=Streptomyces cavernicola TaxID=3043613 RepID=A0ABT6S936_9ACTN|nr:histidine kinase [Streptomyces sp. B-S-A6]MDI3404611.1 histidine kinase [Streptomyces sp. B-S-A6]
MPRTPSPTGVTSETGVTGLTGVPRTKRALRALAHPVTYTRWVHLFVGGVAFGIWQFVSTHTNWVPFLCVALAGLVPWVRVAEGVQARLLLTPDGSAPIATGPSVTWADRGRTSLWMLLRLTLGLVSSLFAMECLVLAVDLVRAAAGGTATGSPLPLPGHHWWYALLAPLPLLVLLGSVVLFGRLMTELAVRLLGPSAAERLAALEARTEQLLERTRIARELHDSIGHALTVAVVQAGAARAAGSPEFTDRALDAIEETGRAALEDLDRVLKVLREPERPAGSSPALTEADRLLDSARASGAQIDAEVTGPLDRLPGPVSREGYRILQECLTNVLRHAGAPSTATVRVRIAATDRRLTLDVRNPFDRAAWAASAARPSGSGSGLRGIRERVALLGGTARTGPESEEWRVHVDLPLR